MVRVWLISICIYIYIDIDIWVVVWNMFLNFPYIYIYMYIYTGNVIIPIDEVRFFRGVGFNHQPGISFDRFKGNQQLKPWFLNHEIRGVFCEKNPFDQPNNEYFPLSTRGHLWGLHNLRLSPIGTAKP